MLVKIVSDVWSLFHGSYSNINKCIVYVRVFHISDATNVSILASANRWLESAEHRNMPFIGTQQQRCPVNSLVDSTSASDWLCSGLNTRLTCHAEFNEPRLLLPLLTILRHMSILSVTCANQQHSSTWYSRTFTVIHTRRAQTAPNDWLSIKTSVT